MHFFHQVITYFAWVNCALDAAAAAKRVPLIVNCDETAIAFTYTGRKGNVVRTSCNGQSPPIERARLAERRGTITHLAFTCNTPGLQKHLPQILLGNAHRFTVQALRETAAETPRNVHMWRDKSSWMNHIKIKQALKLLSSALRPRGNDQVILVLDCARCHLRPDVITYAARLGIWVVVVPSKLTHLLQPLDVYTFATCKRALVDAYYKARLRAKAAVLTPADWLRVLLTTVATVFNNTDWEHSFPLVGLSDDQSGLNSAIQQALRSEAPLVFGRTRPTAADIAYLGGTGFCMPYVQLMKPFGVHAHAEDPPQHATRPPPISSRTRSMSKSSLPAAASASSSSHAQGPQWRAPTAVKMHRAKSFEQLDLKNMPEPPLPPPAEPPQTEVPTESSHPGVMTRAMKRKASLTQNSQ